MRESPSRLVANSSALLVGKVQLCALPLPCGYLTADFMNLLMCAAVQSADGRS